MFRTHKLSFWYQFLVGGNAHIIQGFESEHSYFPTFIVVFSLTACTSHVYPIYYILSMIQCTSILTPCFQSVIQSPRTVLVLPRVLSFVSLFCLAEKIKLLLRNMFIVHAQLQLLFAWLNYELLSVVKKMGNPGFPFKNSSKNTDCRVNAFFA